VNEDGDDKANSAFLFVVFSRRRECADAAYQKGEVAAAAMLALGRKKGATATAASSRAPPVEMRGDALPHSPQIFVSVAFDFDYEGDDGKRVAMREGEILLLISKTNRDWWQVRLILIPLAVFFSPFH